MKRVLPTLALLILIIGAFAGAYLTWDWWQKNKDTDDDGLNDKFEVDNNLDPLNPNPTYVYLMEKDALGHYDLFKDLDKKGNLTENEKSAIDYFNI